MVQRKMMTVKRIARRIGKRQVRTQRMGAVWGNGLATRFAGFGK